MSNESIIKDFRSFGNKMIPMGIISIITFITLVIALVIPALILNIGILVIIFFLRIALMIILFIALMDIKNINSQLNSSELNDFRIKIITAFILGLISYICYIIAFSFLSAFLRTENFLFIAPFTIFIIAGIILAILSGVYNIQGWGKLESFFEIKGQMFESNIGGNSKNGAFICKLGAIFYVTFVLLVIGELLFAIGYFFLIKLRDVRDIKKIEYKAPATHVPLPQQKPISSPTNGFCPNCGAAVKRTAHFCTQCGTEIDVF